MTLEHTIAETAQQKFDFIKQHNGIHTLLFEPLGNGSCFVASHHPALGRTHVFGAYEHRIARRIITLAKKHGINVQVI